MPPRDRFQTSHQANQAVPLWRWANKAGPLWRSVIKAGPLWRSVIKAGPLWRSVIKAGPLWKLVTKPGPLWRLVIKPEVRKGIQHRRIRLQIGAWYRRGRLLECRAGGGQLEIWLGGLGGLAVGRQRRPTDGLIMR
eukprot:superscaffoldBa00001139_g9144